MQASVIVFLMFLRAPKTPHWEGGMGGMAPPHPLISRVAFHSSQDQFPLS